MNLTEEQLEEITQMAGLFFDPETIAINLELDDEKTEYFIAAVEYKNMKNPIVKAYFKGRLASQVALRVAIKQSAGNGSSTSQQNMLRFMNESES